MLLTRFESDREVPDNSVSTISTENDGSLEICNRYDVAPATAFQFSVGEVETLIEASTGDNNTGAGGMLVVVLKFHTAE